MKIVASMDNDNYLCQVNIDEIESMVGYNGIDSLTIGDDIPLDRIIKAANWINLIDKKMLSELIKEVEKLQQGLGKTQELANALNMFSRLSEKNKGEVDVN